MAFNRNPYAKYGNNKVMTASPAELTLLLYEGAIKFCNLAIVAIEKKDIQSAHNNLMKAQKIIDEFRCTLDHSYPVAKDFDNVYILIGRLLIEANMRKDAAIVNQALEHLRVMRDTWKEVMKNK